MKKQVNFLFNILVKSYDTHTKNLSRERNISASQYHYNKTPNKKNVMNKTNYSCSVEPIYESNTRPNTTKPVYKSKKNDRNNGDYNDASPRFSNQNKSPKTQIYMNVANDRGYEVSPNDRRINNNKLRVDHILGFSEELSPR